MLSGSYLNVCIKIDCPVGFLEILASKVVLCWCLSSIFLICLDLLVMRQLPLVVLRALMC